ncbi:MULTISPECIES: hypothetical protein [Streptomyces]|uniref:Uncharacterized protein n=2 Tax=Streptomyces TaxID=1883 RepID=A0A100YA88_9ACTN|nr:MULTISPECIES: hypothetical protein [Streptomyces]KUH40544.1 hypothetical protein ATE80_01245 [Streptomyces kanasensis]UUS33684.1 hypothetical protein NRO40_24570 [Streptomyces changanensis]
MGRRARLTVAGALPSVLLAAWSLVLVLFGTAPAAHAAAGPVALPTASARADVVRPGARPAPDSAVSDAASPRTTAREHTVRPPGEPPAAALPVDAFPPAPLRGVAACGPCQERGPPRGTHDPRYIRGPPSSPDS